MKLVLYVDRNDFVESSKEIPMDQLKVEHLRTLAMRTAFEADMVIVRTINHSVMGGPEYILKDRG